MTPLFADGSLGAIIILLTWFYITGLMMLLGARRSTAKLKPPPPPRGVSPAPRRRNCVGQHREPDFSIDGSIVMPISGPALQTVHASSKKLKDIVDWLSGSALSEPARRLV